MVPVHIAQLQFFQLAAVLLLFFSVRGNCATSSWACPIRWLVLAAISHLFFYTINQELLDVVRIIILAGVFFEACVMYEIKFKNMRRLLVFLLIVSFIACIWQTFNWKSLVLTKPFYFELPPIHILSYRGNRIFGIWNASAYLATATAMTIPFLFLWKSKIGLWAKWPCFAICGWILWSADISSAILALVFFLLFFIYHRIGRGWFCLALPTLIAGAVGYYFLFDFVNAFRSMLWGDSIISMQQHDKLFSGYGLGSFIKFGLKFTLDNGMGKGVAGMAIAPNGLAEFWAEAHNEYLQAWFEMGILGIILSLWLILRILHLGVKNKLDDISFYLCGALIPILVMAFFQPIFHIPSICVYSICIYAMLESRENQLRRQYVN